MFIQINTLRPFMHCTLNNTNIAMNNYYLTQQLNHSISGRPHTNG